MIRLTDSENGLIQTACEAMDVLGIHDAAAKEVYFPHREEFSELLSITHQEVLNADIYPMLYKGPTNERGHPTRVAIMGMCISKLLEFDQDARIAAYLLGVSHDDGKLKMKDEDGNNIYPENNPYLPGSRKYLKYIEQFKQGHVAWENIPKHWGMMNALAAYGSHRHQSGTCQNKPYPKKLVLPQTAESLFLSKLLAVPDFTDAVSSRPCKFTGKYHSPEEIVSLAEKEYGEMRIFYDGDLFPKTDINGRELIQELHRTRFAGREKPVNISERDFRMNPFVDLEIK